MGKALEYLLIGTLFWVSVDFVTTQAIIMPYEYYSVHFPVVLIFYIGYPLVFSIMIFKASLGDRSLFVATIIGMLIVEVLLTHNAAIYSYPLFLVGIPAAVAIYSFLTFVPKWIVEGIVRENLCKTLVLLSSVILISLLNVLGSST